MTNVRRLARAAAITVLGCAALLAAGCAALPGNAAPVVKIGVIAPFEGAGRPLGYAVLPAIKGVVAEANSAGGVGGRRVMVVAFNDSLDPSSAAEQASALALDGDVVAVIGPFTEETASAARPVLEATGLPFEPVISVEPLDSDYAGEIAEAQAATRRALERLAKDVSPRPRSRTDF